MGRTAAAVGTAAFFVVGPGTVAGLVPWWITGWEFREPLPYWAAAQALGALLIAAGVYVLAGAFVAFARAEGTPVPAAPTRRLVVEGFHRYVRNPMYVALIAVVLGQALLFGQLGPVGYALVMWAVAAAFVRWYEEPKLAEQFGGEYAAYRAHVPAWWPRLRPWTPGVRPR
ncbi:methyltransferase family protein [Allonocardiopsis opalescens]|uniref:Phospholipid methyltransferase n=1 Tax=Allonocardiopsis opalescens TaxID=1144618 RepID=A0A2T0Q2U9_9ACTN|nr:isoprenylcysteine carboxylmethyltransferase family protein [Allonocardiopsis opalescens]PRX98121.1 phospholipid methyltransferase [Allonocardiopsis opalescens]